MDYTLTKEWSNILANRFKVEYKKELFSWLESEYNSKTIFPTKQNVFAALNLSPIKDVKVVIIGQDPYHTPGQAHGLAFSCANGTPQPSLTNIFKEINADLGLTMTGNTDLTSWAKQGVMLLNTSLTVVAHTPASHSNKLWHTFTTEVVKILNEQNQPIVFMLWGNHAKSFLPLLTNSNHLILTALTLAHFLHTMVFSAVSTFLNATTF